MPANSNRGVREIATAADLLEYQTIAQDLAIARLIAQTTDLTPADADRVHVRNIIPDVDLDAEGGTYDNYIGQVDDPIWEQDAGTGLSITAGDDVGLYALDSREGLEDKAITIYGFQNLARDADDHTEFPFSFLEVRTRTGGLIDMVDLSSIDLAEDVVANTLLWENPLTLGTRSAFLGIVAETDLSDDDTVGMKLLGFVAEEEGEELEAADRFASFHL